MKYVAYPVVLKTLCLLSLTALIYLSDSGRFLPLAEAQVASPKTTQTAKVAKVAKANKKLFTKDDVLDRNFDLSPRRSAIATWSGPDAYTLTQDGDTRRVHARTGAVAPPLRPIPYSVKGPAETERAQLFIRDKNLWVTQGIKTRQLTTDGGGNILNGELDWVYEEEVYGRGGKTSYTLSPDQKYAAFLRIDEAPVKPFFINEDSGVQRVESWQYPKSGTPNPRASLGVVPIAGGTTPTFVDLSKYP
jgi:hypothetical protein